MVEELDLTSVQIDDIGLEDLMIRFIFREVRCRWF